MKEKLKISEELKQKYHKCEEVTNFKQILDRSAEIYKTRTAFKLKDKDGNIYNKTYEELKADVTVLGTSLIENGLLNKRIAVIGKNSYKWAISYLAASIVGVVVPIDKELHSDDVINFMNVSESKCILGDSKNLKKINENIEKLENKETLFIDFDSKIQEGNSLSFAVQMENGKTLVEEGNTEFDKITVNPDELKILLFTSGTTGNAKGVCLSQRNICSNILSIYGIVKVKRSDLFFSILPLHHTYECTIGFLLPLYSGASICYCDGLRYITSNMLEYHPSVILCVPLLLEKMYQKIIKSIQKTLPKKYTENLKENENIIFEGIYSHFSNSLASDNSFSNIQYERLINVIEKIEKEKITFKYKHICNSSGFFKYKDKHLNAARVGSAFSGCATGIKTDLKKIGLFHTKLTKVRNIKKGDYVGYANSYIAKKDMKIGILETGYYDGVGLELITQRFKFKSRLKNALLSLKSLIKGDNMTLNIDGKIINVIGQIGMHDVVIDITGLDYKEDDDIYFYYRPVYINENVKRVYK